MCKNASPVLIISILLLHVVLGPVDVGGLGGQSSNVESHKGDANSHDHEQRLQSHVVFQ